MLEAILFQSCDLSYDVKSAWDKSHACFTRVAKQESREEEPGINAPENVCLKAYPVPKRSKEQKLIYFSPATTLFSHGERNSEKVLHSPFSQNTIKLPSKFNKFCLAEKTWGLKQI
jgi:hypothetical protein